MTIANQLIKGITTIAVLRPLLRREPRLTVMNGLGLVGAGILVGGALGLLLAPTTGRRLRSEIKQRAEEAVADAGEETAPRAGRRHA